MFSLESPHRGDSNGCTQYTIFNYKERKKITLNYLLLWDFFSKEFKNEFETAVVNEPSVFEPLEVYRTFHIYRSKAYRYFAELSLTRHFSE